MSIRTIDINIQQRDSILVLDEDHFHDLKSIDIAPSKLSRTVSAFANATGGELYVGIDEVVLDNNHKVRKWRGFADPESANGHIQLFDELFPLGQFFAYSFLRCRGESGLVLYVEIQKTPDIKTSSDRTIYVRRGAHNRPLTSQQEQDRLKLDKGIISFETQTTNVDIAMVIDSPITRQFLAHVVPTAEAHPWLKSQNLVRGNKPTVAAVLLFAEEPQALLPKRCGIKLYRYATSQPDGSRATLVFDPLTIEGCLYQQILAAVSKTVELVEDMRTLGLRGFEDVKYPQETLHEIITNAVLHRDYAMISDIHIRIFDNRIEVESPGRLPGHITENNILDEQFARNGSLVRIIVHV